MNIIVYINKENNIYVEKSKNLSCIQLSVLLTISRFSGTNNNFESFFFLNLIVLVFNRFLKFL